MGTTKPISGIEDGDVVLAQDPGTAEIGARRVTDTWVHDDDLVRLEIDGDVVRTTKDHPFRNDTDKQWWQRADQLVAGDTVLTAEGRRVKVGVLVGSAGRGSAYNFTVEGLHTYHILSVRMPVWSAMRAGNTKTPGLTIQTRLTVASESVLPSNAHTLFAQSVEVNGVRWTKVGTGSKAVFHRFANDGQGNWHWNGSTDGVTNAGKSNVISPNNAPVAGVLA
jgi:Pretoxin HINT domain